MVEGESSFPNIFRYNLGGGPAKIESKGLVNDSKQHMLRVTRVGRIGSLKLDNQEVVIGSAPGIFSMLNVPGHVYLGIVFVLFFTLSLQNLF